MLRVGVVGLVTVGEEDEGRHCDWSFIGCWRGSHWQDELEGEWRSADVGEGRMARVKKTWTW